MVDTVFVLDSSAFLSGKDLFLFRPMLTTESVQGELRRLGKELVLTRYPELEYATPTREALREVEQIAGRTGDLRRLSRPDTELVALALELGGTMVSDDYSIQNICEEAGIRFCPLSERGISEKRVWTVRCSGCGRFFPELEKDSRGKDCPVCGAGLRTVRKGRSNRSREKP